MKQERFTVPNREFGQRGGYPLQQVRCRYRGQRGVIINHETELTR